MALSITVHQKNNLFKQRLDLPTLQKQFGAAVKFGGIGPYFSFLPEVQPPSQGMEAEYMLRGVSGPLGRGFYLYITKGFASFEVTTALPTTTHDLEDMFTFIGLLANFLGEKTVQDENGVATPRSALPTLYAEVLKRNEELLKSVAAGRPGFAVSCIKYPLQLPQALCRRIASVPPLNGEKFFSAYLSEKQAGDYYYLKPLFSRDEAGAPVATYTLTEGVDTIIPLEPFIPYGPSPYPNEVIAQWQVSMTALQLGLLGRLPYATFLQRLEENEQRPFDEMHVILRGLSLKRMQQLLGGAGG